MSDYERIVAVECAEDSSAEIFWRLADGNVRSQRFQFSPWLLLEEQEDASQLYAVTELRPLTGDGALRYQVFFQDLPSYTKSVAKLAKLSKSQGLKGSYRLFPDIQQQILFSLHCRLFHGLDFSELRRLQLDIETHCEASESFPNPGTPEDIVTLISLKDNTGWEICLDAHDGGEKALLERMLELVAERDPDVIEGHNIHDFDLRYLAIRCKLHGLKLALGRGGREAKSRPSRFTAGERTKAYQRFDIYGRHIIDTYHLVQLYDVIHRDMDSHGLKYAAKYFGVSAPERTYVAGEDISEMFESNPERLRDYCLDDVRETAAIANILSPSYFYQARVVPLSYQNCLLRGTAARVDAILCADYLHQRAALPWPQEAQEFAGAVSEATETGIFHDVWHADVRSLYPSVMLASRLGPASDYLGSFLRFLEQFRKFRLEAKDASKRAQGAEREHWEALQSSWKILINSFYGYLGFGQATFNDFTQASEVTSQGRAILLGMRDVLTANGATVIEMDTDGLYFQAGQEKNSGEELAALIQQSLPAGITVELDAHYPAMYSYKSKNYALLDDKGRVHIAGAALKSRGMEPFLRNYISRHLEMLLQDRAQDTAALYEEYVQKLQEHQLPLADLAKREYLSQAPDKYLEQVKTGKSKRSAALELAASAKRVYKMGDSVQYFVTGNKKSVSVVENSRLLEQADPSSRDENVPYYLDKLRQIHEKLL